MSYANEDRAYAETLAGALEHQGFSVWWDRQIPLGRSFDDVIEEALGGASCVIVLWSQKSVRSRWVKNEAAQALERGILVPALIEEVVPPLAFRDIEAARLVGWIPNTEDAEFDLLLHTLEKKVGKPDVTSTKAGFAVDQNQLDSVDSPTTAARRTKDFSRVHWLLGSRENLSLTFVRVEVIASWLAAAGLGCVWFLHFSEDLLNAVLVFIVIGLASAASLGTLSWRNHFRLGIVQGWVLPPLAFGLCILTAFSVHSIVSGDAEKYGMLGVLLIPPGLITLGGYKTCKAIRNRNARNAGR